jgi:hypothetical protein
MTCAHDTVVEGSGQIVCTACGLVLDDRLMVSDWVSSDPSKHKSSYYVWYNLVKDVLRCLGISRDVADSFPRPYEGERALDARWNEAPGLRLRVIAGYMILQRYAQSVSSEEVREAAGANAREWARAAHFLGQVSQPDRDDMTLHRLARSLGLPDAIARASMRAMDTSRLECCDPTKVLAALTAESLGDEVSSRLFRLPECQISAFREKYRLKNYAVDLTVPGMALQLHVERCKNESLAGWEEEEALLRQGYVQPWWHGTPHMKLSIDRSQRLQKHLVQCIRCASRAEELGLAFLLRL